MALVQAGLGDTMGIIIQSFSTFLASLLVSLIFSWKLTLVILSLVPVLVLTAFLNGKVMADVSYKEQTAYAAAGSIAEEVISSIRTVVSFGAENREIKRYVFNV